MKVALVYSSKTGMATSSKRISGQEITEDDDEPPPDQYAECDSDETVLAIQKALQERWEVFPIESDEYAFSRLQQYTPNLVFNIAERLVGPNRESHIPVLCEILNIPYTGSDPLTLGICLVKSRAKEILSYYNIPNPRFWVVESVDMIPTQVQLPVIVKPLYEGSSKGIRDNSVIKTTSALKERVGGIIALYDEPVILEHFLEGREFTIGILGNYPNHEILPIVEIDHSQLPEGANPIYSYEAKWIWDTPEKPLTIFQCPANISRSLEEKINAVITQTYKILRIRDWCRIDIRLDSNGEPNILEVNPLPGVLPNPEENSCLPKAARAAGYSYSKLIQRVVQEAANRYKFKL